MVKKIAVMLSAFMSMMAMDVEAESAYISSNLPDIEFRYCYPVTSIDKTYKTSTTYDSVNISEPSYFLCNGSAIQSLYFDDSNQTRTFTAPDVSGKKFLGWYGVGGSKNYAPDDGYKYPSDFNTLIGSGRELTQQTLSSCVKNKTIHSGVDFKGTIGAPIRAKYRDLYKYTITYEPGTKGSGSQQTQSKTEDVNVTLKGNAFTRTGYTQTGWAESDGGSKAYDLNADYSGNAKLTLYPVWTANTYTVAFDANGGSVSTTSKTVTYDSTYGTLPTPTRTGYTFDGWFTTASGGSQVKSDTKVAITAAQTLYAQWTANAYTVTFNANGGSVSATSMKVTYGSTYGTLPAPTRTGYTFKGWFTATSGGNQVKSDTKVAITANQTLYAQWESEMRTVVFYDSDLTTVFESFTVEYGTTIKTPSSVTMHTGDVFKWWDDGNVTYPPGSNLTVTENRNYYPVIVKMQTTISASVNPPSAGSVAYVGGHVEETGDAGRIVTVAVEQTSPAYDFSGWSDGVMTLTNTVEVITNMHLTANFTMKTNTVEFLGWNGESLDVQLVPYGGAATNFVPPVCTGLTFVAWMPDDFTDGVTADMTVQALYETNRYTVVYNANGGSGGPMANDVVLYFSEYNIRSNEFTRALHEFWGWSTNPNAATNEFEYGEEAWVSNLTHEANGIVNLYAVWKSLLSEYSIAADCTNLILECNNADRKWLIDSDHGYESTSSIRAEGTGTSSMTALIEGAGTLTFRLKIQTASSKKDEFEFGSVNYTDFNGLIVSVRDEYREITSLYRNMELDDDWIFCVLRKTDPAAKEFMWWFKGKDENDRVYVDQVKWHPGKAVVANVETYQSGWNPGGLDGLGNPGDINASKNFMGSQREINRVTEVLLEKWEDILPDEVTSVNFDVTKSSGHSNVTNAFALLGLGYHPKCTTNGSTATLTFTNAPDLAIGAFRFGESVNARLDVVVTNTSWGLPSWSGGVEQMLGVWGAPSLTSAWSRVDAGCDLSRYVSEGVAQFDFDVGTNRFFKVKAE